MATEPTVRPLGDLEIRPALPTDLTTLADALGDREFFADRIARQRGGRGVLLTAWEDSRPVGVVYVWLEPADEAEVRKYLPGVPLLHHLEVAAERRDHGIGTRLVKAAERVLLARGYDQVALAVELKNVGAARLYVRLGFRRWAHGRVVCYSETSLPDGSRKLRPDTCFMLAKQLTDNGPAAG